ncbi:MAG: hypothetical protein MJZ37_06055 [Bacilli bacterium]|nr:hypothetical protein [Bacilli bacterium]
MKRRYLTLLVAAMSCVVLTGCHAHTDKLTEIGDYFYEAPTYTELDFDFVENYFRESNDNWGGGCSAISKVIDGKRIVGRNMDLNIARKCAYLVRTDVPKKYETFGISFTFRTISPDLEDVKKNGLGETWGKVLPFMCDDVINEKGLHIEINMRHNELDDNGNDVFGVEHTNPNVSNRVYVFGISQYLALNCKNLPEVKEYLANKVDVYSKKNYWNYSFLVTDAEGNSELLEFGKGKYHFVAPDENGVVAQANFYRNPECNAVEKIKTGTGRYDTLMAGIGNVKNKTDMYNLMKKIQYSSFYLPYDECKSQHFDPRSELVGEAASKEGLSALYKTVMETEVVPENIGTGEDFIMDDANELFVKTLCDYIHSSIWEMSREEKAELNYVDGGANALWESTFTEVVDPKEKSIQVRLFENENYLYKIDFNGVKSIQEIK